MALSALLLATVACNEDSSSSSPNPFFEEWSTPFGMPPFDKIKTEHFIPAFEEGMKRENAEIESIIRNSEAPSFENTIVPYTESGQFISRISGAYGALTSSMMTDELKEVQQKLSPMLTRHNNAISMNDSLFARVKAVHDNMEGLDATQRRLTEKIYRSFVRSGADLSPDNKEQLKKINEQISELSLRFGNNLLKEMNRFYITVTDTSSLAGLPSDAIEAAATEARKRGHDGKWVFTLDKASMLPFLQYSPDAAKRKELYMGYINRCNGGGDTDNNEIVDSLVNLRLKRAKLLGYPDYASYVLENNMAGNTANVYELLNELWTPALKRAKKELAEMKAIKVAEGKGSRFDSWDWWYYAEKLRKAKYDLDENQIRPYFSIGAVQSGIFTVVGKLYGITFKEVKGAPVYNDECSVYEVFDKDGSHLGAIVLDMHPRSGKRVGAWCSSYRSQSYKDGIRVAPISTITCNFTRPTSEAPALLSIDEVETFFHEFGHAVHGLVSDVKYSGLKGTPRDFVELPSQIMENWATHPQVLKLYAKHYKNGEVIPDSLITKINNSSLFNKGFVITELVAAALLDMDYHTIRKNGDIDVLAFESAAMKKRGLIPEIEPRYRSTYFQHIFNGGYAAGYYGYIWSQLLDADAFAAFVETGDVFDRKTADKFRKLLEVGSSRDEAETYAIFRGHGPSKKPLKKRLGLE
ncbi:MAG: M3 family metallopeptidase [Rikenellaceae bacterium]|nr:M3 family metallopeptidase [Rikenellaceae bacterium]